MSNQFPITPLRLDLLLLLPIASGLLTLLLLPIGMHLGVGGFWYGAVSIAALLVFGAAVFVAAVRLGALFREGSWVWRLLCAISLLIFAAASARAWLPVTARDALVHHLAVPKWWIAAGRITEIPWHEWSYYPMLTQLLFVFFEQHGIAAGCGILHALYLFVAAAVVADATLNFNEKPLTACCAALLMLTVPAMLRLCGTPLVDLPLALYSAIGFSMLIQGVQAERFSLMALSGAAFGLGFDTKYNGLLGIIVAVLAVLPMVVRGSGWRRAVALLAVFSAVVGVVYLPWALRNIAWVGNPLYPLFGGLFGSPASVPPGPPGLPPIAHRIQIYGESVWQVLLLPLRIFFEGADDLPNRFDGVLSPISLFLFVPLIFPQARRAGWIRAAILFVLGYFALSLVFSALRIRYLSPLLGPAVMLAAVGIRVATDRLRWTFLPPMLVALQIAIAGSYVYGLAQHDGLFDEATLGRERYLNARVPEFPLIETVNLALPTSARVYLLYTGNRFYLYDRATFSGGHFSERYLRAWLRNSADANALRAEFERAGITHLLTRDEPIEAVLEPALDDRERAIWIDFMKRYLQRERAERGFTLYSLVP